MKYDLLKKEFGYFGSFMIWDDSIQKNSLPKKLDNKEFRDERLNSDFIYLAMNIRLDKKNFKDIDKDFLTNDEIFTSNMPAFCGFHSLDDGKYNNTPYTRLNKLYTNTVLEGAYITDFFKVSPNSKKPNGYATRTSDEVFEYLESLNDEDKDNFIRYQFIALERELELLEISTPKFIVMESIYDIFTYYFNKLINEKDFPNLHKAKIIDKPSSFGTVLTKYQSDIIHIFLKNVDRNSYPEFLISNLEKNINFIEKLQNIKNKLHVLAILYICLNENKKFPIDVKYYIEDIKKTYFPIIGKIQKSFSNNFIYELIKNLPYIYGDKSIINENLENLYKNFVNENVLFNINQNFPNIINLFKVKEIQKHSFLLHDFDSYIFVQIFKKSLGLKGNVYYKDDKKLNDLEYDRFFSSINKNNLKFIDNIIEKNKFTFINLFLDYKDFKRLWFEEFKEKLFDKNFYSILNFNNYKLLLSMGKIQENIEYAYYDDKHNLFFKEYITKENLNGKSLLLASSCKSKINSPLTLGDFLLSIKRGYQTTEFSKDWKNDINSKKGIKYLTNSNINKGFINKSNCSIFELINENREKYYNYAQKDDIIITKNSPYSAAIVENNEKYLVNDNCFILKIDKNKIDPYYILAFLSSKKLIRSINTNALSIRKINSLPINLHSLEEIEKISSEMKNIIKNLEDIYENFSKLDYRRENIFNNYNN
ncbi:MAG: hypothetical protein E7G18_07495 [Anaerococcus hydrogenalis]|uniref:hypothetical protein n=1 Tax=Anaerococcus hydrogenalis TaxID=33029 RepID=UPI0029096F43|nr:hypothetical protein [Anaerococcus hydrogenalis]MDU3688515.1 hypothetical protein [Anaerococcus hydrogenalis]